MSCLVAVAQGGIIVLVVIDVSISVLVDNCPGVSIPRIIVLEVVIPCRHTPRPMASHKATDTQTKFETTPTHRLTERDTYKDRLLGSYPLRPPCFPPPLPLVGYHRQIVRLVESNPLPLYFTPPPKSRIPSLVSRPHTVTTVSEALEGVPNVACRF